MAEFNVNQKVLAKQNNIWRQARVEQIDEREGGVFYYYVHYIDFDRRLDAWVSGKDINTASATRIAPPSQSPITTRSSARMGAADAAVPATPARKGSKRLNSDVSKFYNRPKNIMRIYYGPWELEPWYFSPYNLANKSVRQALEENNVDVKLSDIRISHSPLHFDGPMRGSSQCDLHMCPYCLRTYLCDDDITHHLEKNVCPRHPPGREVYRDVARSNLIMFEMDGRVERAFCERLALLSKMFLEHKTIDYDLSPFIFYVLCTVDRAGCSVVGYFSKEKSHPENYNLSCILTLPQYQNRGFGRFLIEASYEMTRREGLTGTPEKPLSDLGFRSYSSYWRDVVLEQLVMHDRLDGLPFSIDTIRRNTGMTEKDIVDTMKLMKVFDSKSARVHLSEEAIKEFEQRRIARSNGTQAIFDANMLCWSPEQYEVTTIGPRVPWESASPKQQ